MRIAYWVTKATGSYSEYVTFIAFTLQQWLHQRTSIVRYTYIVCSRASCDTLLSFYPSSRRSTAADLSCRVVSNSTVVSRLTSDPANEFFG